MTHCSLGEPPVRRICHGAGGQHYGLSFYAARTVVMSSSCRVKETLLHPIPTEKDDSLVLLKSNPERAPADCALTQNKRKQRWFLFQSMPELVLHWSTSVGRTIT